MAEENKHPPTTEEQAPPEMPGKAPEMEQAEIPDVGGAPAPSAKVIDLSAVRSAPEKDAPPDIPKEPEAPPVSVTEYSKQEWEKPMPEPEKPKPKRGRPAKAEKAAPAEPGAKKEEKAEKPRRGRPPKAEKTAPEQTDPPKAGKTHAAPEEKAAPPAPEVPPTPRDATRGEKEEIVYCACTDGSYQEYVEHTRFLCLRRRSVTVQRVRNPYQLPDRRGTSFRVDTLPIGFPVLLLLRAIGRHS